MTSFFYNFGIVWSWHWGKPPGDEPPGDEPLGDVHF